MSPAAAAASAACAARSHSACLPFSPHPPCRRLAVLLLPRTTPRHHLLPLATNTTGVQREDLPALEYVMQHRVERVNVGVMMAGQGRVSDVFEATAAFLKERRRREEAQLRAKRAYSPAQEAARRCGRAASMPWGHVQSKQWCACCLCTCLAGRLHRQRPRCIALLIAAAPASRLLHARCVLAHPALQASH